jgi:hypothetical protein
MAYDRFMADFKGFDHLPAFLSLFDPGWWDRMLDATNTGHASPEALLLMAVIFGTFFTFIAIGLMVKTKYRPSDIRPSTWITRPAEVRALVETALTQRSKMRVSFVRDDPGTRSTDAAILTASPGRGIELEMTSLVRANQTWVGKLVACDFRLRLDPQRDLHSFYNFVAPILAINKAGDNFIHMTVDWPSRLELEQKRGFLRVEPPRGVVLELEMWHETTIKNIRGRFADPATWGDPILRFDSRLETPDVELRNISGGGLRLEIQHDAYRRYHRLFEPGSRFITRLLLAEPEIGQPVEYNLALRLQNTYGDAKTMGLVALGYRIMSFAVPGDTPGEPLSWKTAAAGVPSLDDWAFRRHLAIYRQRGE